MKPIALTAVTGRIDDRICPVGWQNSIAPLRAWDNRSLSPPSWLSGKTCNSIRPLLSLAIRSPTSRSRLLNGCAAGVLVPIL